MDPNWSKFDRELQKIFSNYLEIKDKTNLKEEWVHPVLKNGNKNVSLTLQYSGNLPDIEKCGFDTTSLEREGVANGVVNLDSLIELSNCNGVLKLTYGEEVSSFLDTSVLEMLARGSTPGTNCVWDVNKTTGVFSGMTGEDVIIGIIDSGIEWRHLNFMKEKTTDKTRIISIWDPGLIPAGTEKGPDVSLLSAGPTYGVEYSGAMIDADLSGASPSTIRHKDCGGHGTHVTGIAAGNGQETRFMVELPFNFCGVAPKAKIIVVKFLHLENEPGAANPLKRFKDAITYILKIADRGGVLPPDPAQPALPVVINCSWGNNLGPHDGLEFDGNDGQQTFLESTFKAATGKICVFAGSNDSGARQHAIITIPAGGSVEIPFELYDPRTVRKDFNKCKEENNTKPLSLAFWYQDSVAGLKAQFKLNGDAYSLPVVGTADPPIINKTYNVNKKFSLFHNSTTVQRLGSPLSRNLIFITVTPHANLHKTGKYFVKLTGPANAKIHVWCMQARKYGFKIHPAQASTAAIQITDNNTIGQPSDTPSVITVAAYNDTIDRMACFSSKGPLVDYSGLGVVTDKPDIAGPGEEILSANSYQTESTGDKFSLPGKSNYVAKGGTSMAAPHIAGLVALLLQKKKTLTLTNIKAELNARARTRPTIYPNLLECKKPVLAAQPVATANESGSGKVDSFNTWKNI